MSIDNIRKSFEDARRLLSDFVGDGRNMAAVDAAAELLAGVLRAGGKVMSCGNGGSMADAMHFAEELTGRFREDRPALPAIAVSDPTHLTCVGNDFGFDRATPCWPSAPPATPPTSFWPWRRPGAAA